MEDTCNNCEPGHFFLELWWRPTTRGRVDLLEGLFPQKLTWRMEERAEWLQDSAFFLYAGANGESLHSFINWGNKFCPHYDILNSGCDVAYYRIIIKLIEPGLWIIYLFDNYSCHSNRCRTFCYGHSGGWGTDTPGTRMTCVVFYSLEELDVNLLFMTHQCQ